MKQYAGLALIFLSLQVFGYEEPTFNEFYADPKNIEKFEALKSAGAIEQVRGKMSAICRKWNLGKENLDAACECVKKEVANISDKDLVYISVMAYTRYQAKVTAIESDDKEKLAELKARFKKMPLTGDDLKTKCG